MVGRESSKLLSQCADKHAGDFSDARASFFVGPSIYIGVVTGKNNGIWGG
jgi:hypothetical protein